MLYDPSKEYKASTWEDEDIYSFENFARWLGEQPPEKVYNFWDTGNCAISAFLRAYGWAVVQGHTSVDEEANRLIGSVDARWGRTVTPQEETGYLRYDEAARRARELLDG